MLKLNHFVKSVTVWHRAPQSLMKERLNELQKRMLIGNQKSKTNLNFSMMKYSTLSVFSSKCVSIDQSLVDIFFKTHEVTTLKRSEMYKLSDFLAIGGGLLGLFLGVSLLSIVELIYFFTLRLFWNIRQLKANIVAPAPRQTLPIISRDIWNWMNTEQFIDMKTNLIE